jgi:hypothetical protein
VVPTEFPHLADPGDPDLAGAEIELRDAGPGFGCDALQPQASFALVDRPPSLGLPP